MTSDSRSSDCEPMGASRVVTSCGFENGEKLARMSSSPALARRQIGSPGNYLQARFAIRAYSAYEEIVDADLVEAEDAQVVVDRFFARPDTAFLHVRFPSYGCFACRLDRA